jgi:putative heme-binding domain-containing protein
MLEGIAQGLKSRKLPASVLQAEKHRLVNAVLDHPSSAVRRASLSILKVVTLPEDPQIVAAIKRARQQAGNHHLDAEERAQAISFLAISNPAQHQSFLHTLLVPGEALPVQLAALNALSAIPGQAVSQRLLEQWTSLTPEVGDAAITTFMSTPERIKLLLDAIEAGQIHQASLGWPRSVSLMAHADESLRKRARVLLTKKDTMRQEVIQKYQAALDLEASSRQGKLVFQQNCIVCHQIGGVGLAFGPDLTSIKNRRPASIMSDILDPNLSIADGYDLWVVELKNGESMQGIILTETPNAITLRNAAGLETTIARQDIQQLKALGMSAMPTGLEKQINQQDMADLLAFIRQAK